MLAVLSVGWGLSACYELSNTGKKGHGLATRHSICKRQKVGRRAEVSNHTMH